MSSAASPTNGTHRVITVDEVAALLRAGDIATCESLVKEWKEALPYQRAGLAEELVAHLQDKGSCPARGYQWKKGDNDRSLIAGRAKWAMEELLEVHLPDVDQSTETKDLATLQKNAQSLLDKRKADLVANQKEHDPRREELAEKYKGKINPGISAGAPGSVTAIQGLLAEWPPIGRRIQDLAAIIGSQGEKIDGQVSYKFDTGYGGFDYHFSVEQGTITSVKIYGID